MKVLHPTRLSFARIYAVGVLLMAWGVAFLILVNTTLWSNDISKYIGALHFLSAYIFGSAASPAAAMFWVVVTFIASLISLRLARGHRHWLIFFGLILLIILSVLGLRELSFFGTHTIYYLFGTTFGAGVVAFVLADVYRRAYKYYITNQRISIIRKFLTYSELYFRYENLADIDVYVTVPGRIFSYGDIVPISNADIGAGENLIGRMSRSGVKIKGTEVARKTPSECFFGVRKPYMVRSEMAEYMQKSSASYELKQIQAELKAKAT